MKVTQTRDIGLVNCVFFCAEHIAMRNFNSGGFSGIDFNQSIADATLVRSVQLLLVRVPSPLPFALS